MSWDRALQSKREVIKRDHVRLEESASLPVTRQPPGATHGPVRGVRLVHVDGRVQAIEFTCRCGEVSLLELEYEQTNQTPRAGGQEGEPPEETR